MKYLVILYFTCIFTLIHGETTSLEERMSSLENEVHRLRLVERELQRLREVELQLQKYDARFSKLESKSSVCSKLVSGSLDYQIQ